MDESALYADSGSGDQRAPAPREARQTFGASSTLWGIKSSFVGYDGRMPDGRSVFEAGVRPLDDGRIVFPPLRSGRRTTQDNAEERFWEFGGSVTFTGHFGMLQVRIASPTIAVRYGIGEMTVADPFATEGGEPLVLANLTLQAQPAPPGLLIWTSNEVRMAPQVSELFNDVYQAGEPFDPLTLLLPDRG
jgi:hypothetical protein